MKLQAVYQQIPDGETISEGYRFKIDYFARVDRYTLVGWSKVRISDQEAITGETLYEETSTGPIQKASSGGTLDLHVPGQEQAPGSATLSHAMSAWDRVDSSVGSYGLPSSLSAALCDRNNRFYL